MNTSQNPSNHNSTHDSIDKALQSTHPNTPRSVLERCKTSWLPNITASRLWDTNICRYLQSTHATTRADNVVFHYHDTDNRRSPARCRPGPCWHERCPCLFDVREAAGAVLCRRTLLHIGPAGQREGSLNHRQHPKGRLCRGTLQDMRCREGDQLGQAIHPDQRRHLCKRG